MLEIRREVDEDAQSAGLEPFLLYAIYLNGAKAFATEQGDYLVGSPRTLSAVGERVILEADRNSREYREGPGYLVVERTERGYALVAADGLGRDSERRELAEVMKSEWEEQVESIAHHE
jgi:hypothetical protein